MYRVTVATKEKNIDKAKALIACVFATDYDVDAFTIHSQTSSGDKVAICSWDSAEDLKSLFYNPPAIPIGMAGEFQQSLVDDAVSILTDITNNLDSIIISDLKIADLIVNNNLEAIPQYINGV